MDGQLEAGRRTSEVAEPSGPARVLVLGPLAIEHDDDFVHVAGTHRRRILALLASRAGQVVGIDSIVEALWADDPPPTAGKTIQSHIARLRASLAAIDPNLIETAPAGYRLAATAVEVDADVFERSAAAGHRRLAGGDWSGATQALADALAWWRGTPYSDFPDSEFADHERTRLADIYATAVEDLAECRIRSGAARSVTPELERLLSDHPGRERAWGLLMQALYASGRQHDALVAFQRARRSLADIFGLEPGPELRQLERRVLEQDATLAVAQRSDPPAALRPGPGALIGRAAERAWLDEAWQSARRGVGQVRLVLGAPGTGRTRLAAELASQAAADGADIAYARGAADVGAALAGGSNATTPAGVLAALTERSRRRPLLVVVDDLEWGSADALGVIGVVASAVEQLPALMVLIADAGAAGPAVESLKRLDPSGGRTLALASLPDEAVIEILAAEGIDHPAAVSAIVSIADGNPGVARSEAAAWAERLAGERVHRAAATSANALAAADVAHESVLEEVARLVRARARRQHLSSAAWAGRQPYRGLSAYGAADVDVFVGRERLVAELATRVLDRRLVVVTGASGSGKSSLVRAGLSPLVVSGRLPGGAPWRTAVTVPGADPERALDDIEGLDEPGPHLLVVDQFEEAFAASAGAVDSLIARLLDLALDPALDVHIVLVVRGDQYGSLADSDLLRGLAEHATVLVGRPTDDELRRIIEEPALLTGCTVDPALTAAVIADVGDSAGALPLVSTALAEVWEQRDGDTLTLERYEALGGLEASVERLGAAVIEAATGTGGVGEDGVRRALLLLADVTDDGSWVRRGIDHCDVPPDLAGVMDGLVAGRLVVRDGDTFEIVHEIVFRAWSQLQQWMDEARTDLLLAHDLRSAARRWDEQGRSDDLVYRGVRLAAARDWSERDPASLTEQMRAFLAAGTAVADRDRVRVEQQLAREQRAGRRVRRALVAASLLLVVSLVATALAFIARSEADDERDRANAAAATADEAAQAADTAAALAESRRADAEAAQQAEADAREAAEASNRDLAFAALVAESVAARETKRDLAALLAAAAYRLQPGPEAFDALLGVFTSNGSFERTARLDTTRITDAVLAPDGRTLVVTDDRQGVRLLDVESLAELDRLEPIQTSAISQGHVAVSPDGRFVVVASYVLTGPYLLTVWDLATRSRRFADINLDFRPVAIAIDPTGELVASVGGPDGRGAVHSLIDGSPIASFEGDARAAERNLSALGSILFRTDGTLLHADASGAIHVRDPHSGALLAELADSQGLGSMTLETSADGPTLYASGTEGTAAFDVTTGSRSWINPISKCFSMAVAADRLACGREDGGITFLDRATGLADERVDYQMGWVESLVVTPDQSRLIAAGGTALGVWRLDGGGAISHALGTEPDIVPSEYLPDGEILLGRLILDPTVPNLDPAVVDPRTGEVDPLDGVVAAVGDPSNPRRLAALFEDGTAGYYDLDSRARVPEVSIELPFIPGQGFALGDVLVIWSPNAPNVQGIGPGGAMVAPTFELPVRTHSIISDPDGDGVITMEPLRLVARDLQGRVVEPGVLEGYSSAVIGGDVMIASGLDGTLDLFDPRTFEPLPDTLDDLEGINQQLMLSGDGSRLLVTDLDRRVRLVDVRRGSMIGTPVTLGPSRQASSLVLSDAWAALRSDGGQFAASTSNGVVVWELDPDRLLAAVCQIAGRDLSAGEWSQHVGELAPQFALC